MGLYDDRGGVRMFSSSTLFAWMETSDKSIQVKRIVEDRTTQNAVNQIFTNAANELLSEKSPIQFDGKYTPQQDDDEYLYIDGFALPHEITAALQNPQGVEAFEPNSDDFPKIRALFIGKYNGNDAYSVAFQKFKSDQYISTRKLHLFFSNNTFTADKRVGITVGKQIDCLYEDGQLRFASFYFARQIFDLSYYYREATTADVQRFVSDSIISMDDGEDFSHTANSWERRKIASIVDSGTLKNYSATNIRSLAKKTGLDIIVKDKKVVIPSDKKERRIVLGFLDEEVYKGVFSQNLYQTNSKKKAK
mgnify:FL=1|jgi:hypothetical protein